jgi:hypothetical protein
VGAGCGDSAEKHTDKDYGDVSELPAASKELR